MRLKENFVAVYGDFFKNKDLLGEAGVFLSVPPSALLEEEGWGRLAEKAFFDLKKTVSPLLGGIDVEETDFKELVEKVETGYRDQPFWRELIFDFLEFYLEKEKADILQKEQLLLEETRNAYKEILITEAKEKKAVSAFAEKIEKAGFRVDAGKLIFNYLKMMRQDANEAWRVLTTNPAMFSPILVKDENGRTVLSCDAARAENDRLARFLKGLKL